jgi:PAS domain S-box-containing protein
MKDTTREQLIAENEELRQRVATLEASQRRYRTIIDTVPLAIGEINRDGIIVFANAATEKLFGYKPEELVGKRAGDGIEPASAREAFRARFSHTTPEQPTPSPVFARQVNKDGKEIDIRGEWNYLRNEKGEVIGQVTVVADITDLKRADEELAKSKAILQAAIDCLPFNCFAIGLDGRYTLQNSVSKAQHGADVIGKLPEEVCLDEHDLAISLDNNRRAFAGQKVEGEVILSLGGEERFYYNVVAPIRDTEEMYGILGMNIDITERKRAEAALKKAHDELERRVDERTAELRRVNEELAIFRKFAESSSEGFGMSDFDGCIAYANPTLCRLFGEEKAEDVIGKSVSTYHPPDYAHKRQNELFSSLLRDGHAHVEQTVLPRHGTPLQTLQSTFLIRDENGNPLRIAVVITDMTERKQAEEALRASEARFRVTFEEAPVGMAICVGDGVITEVNRAMCRMSGYSQEEFVGRHVRELTHPADRELSRPFLTRLMAGEIPSFTLEKRYLRKDGQSRWAQATTAAIHDANGGIAFALGIVEDITDRKDAEEALRQSEEKYRTLVETSPDGVIVTDVMGRITFASGRLLQEYGAEAEDIFGRSSLDFIAQEDHQRFLSSFQRTVEEGITRDVELDFLRKDGTHFPGEISAALIKNVSGNPHAVVAILRDITERKVAEESLRESERRLRTICDSALDAVVMIDAGGKIRYCNPASERMFGYAGHEMMGCEVHTLLAPACYREQAIQAFSAFRITGQGRTVGKALELTALRKDRTEFPIEISVAAFKISNHWWAAAIIRDVTERHKTQEALERERQSLWRMIQANDHERQLVAYDIHDGLAQYLAGANMQLQVFDGLRESNPEEAKKAYDAAAQLVRQSHTESRRLISVVRPPVIDEIGLETAMVHLVHEQRRYGGPKIELDSDVQFSRLPSILENGIYRIVQEALTNACKHSKSKKVTVTMTQEGQDVRLKVQDSGIGFDPESVEKGHFGLEGIRQRVRLLGGRLTIVSTPGSGTLVQVVVPILEKQHVS